jgi:hypothetical protein
MVIPQESNTSSTTISRALQGQKTRQDQAIVLLRNFWRPPSYPGICLLFEIQEGGHHLPGTRAGLCQDVCRSLLAQQTRADWRDPAWTHSYPQGCRVTGSSAG